MGNFNRGGYGGNRGGGGGFGGGNRGGGRDFRREDRGPVTMTKAVCDECKKPCEVPFRPTAGKPVYCNDCFRGQNAGGQDRPPRRDFGDRPQAPRPSFGANTNAVSTGGSDMKKQLESISFKLDKLIAIMENTDQPKVVSKNEVVKNAPVSTPAKAVSKTEVVKSMVVSLPKKEVKKVAKKKGKK
jgi:CxxC-x17-CxxC domain-containing protein